MSLHRYSLHQVVNTVTLGFFQLWFSTGLGVVITPTVNVSASGSVRDVLVVSQFGLARCVNVNQWAVLNCCLASAMQSNRPRSVFLSISLIRMPPAVSRSVQ